MVEVIGARIRAFVTDLRVAGAAGGDVAAGEEGTELALCDAYGRAGT